MLRGEADAVTGSAVRVWSVAGEVVGAGFVAGPDTVATCAHVVAEALGADPYAASPPAGVVRLDLPLLGGSAQLTAVVSRWLPIGQDGTGDVALLRVREPLPVGARMPPLRRADQVWDRPFRAFGFPDGAWDGVWASGVLRAGQGTGWVQLQSDTGGQPVVGGFSGSAVWDSGAGAVIGMTVAADLSGTTTAYLVPIEQVLGLDPDLLPCPYQGLAPFTEAQAPYFFGRDADIERLVAAVAKEPIVALAGPSGAGKSSLLRAGLVPRLRRAGTQIVELQPGATVDDFEPDGTDQVLVLDQFEEVATRDPRQARDLLEDVVRLTDSGSVRAVLTVRGAALDELLTPTLAQVLDAGTLHVAPLDRANLRETIVRPAERAPGLDFEPGLVDRILDDAGSEPGQLPLVESLLADLWRRREGGRLTWRGYTEAGGVVGAVAQHAERVVSELAGAAPDPQFHVRLRRLFAQLAAPDRGGRFVRVPVRTAALPPEERALVPQLAAGRLLVVGRDAFDVEVVELAHQALIEHWPRLRDWLEQDRAFLAWRAQTDQQRERWESAGRDDGALLRGSSLVAAGEWVPARDAEVAPETREFVARSTTYQRRTARRLRAATAIFAVLALAAGLLAVIAVQRGDRLADELMAANADRLGREATARSLTDPMAAAQLAITAWRSDPSNPAARTALVGSAVAFQDVDLVLPDLRGSLGFLGYNSQDDVTIAASLAPSHTVLLGASGTNPQRWPLPVDGENATFAYGGAWIATVAGNGAVVIWDVATRAVRRTVPMDGKILMISKRPDGRATVVVDRGPAGIVLGTLGVASPSWSERPLPGAASDLASAEVAPDGAKVFEGFLRPQGESWSVRTLAANPADDRETPLPAGTTIVGEGLARLECVPPPDTRSQAAVRIVPVEGDVPARTVGLTAVTCYDTRLSADRHWLVEYANAGWEDAERTMVRLTSVVDGTQFQVLLPPSRTAPLSTKQRNALRPDLSIAVSRPVDGRVTVYAVLADSVDPKVRNSTVVRARAVPIQPGTQNRQVTQDGRYVVTVEPGIGPTVTDRFSNQVLVSASMDLRPNNSSIDVDNDMWVTLREPSGWTLRRYALPSLSLMGTYPLPGDPQATAASFVGGPGDGLQPGDPVVVLAGGVLAARDGQTGAPLGAEVQLRSNDDRDVARKYSIITARPGHPGQAIVNVGSVFELWDAVAGRKLGTVPVESTSRAAITRDGARAAILTPGGTVEVYDLETFRPSRPAIPVSGIDVLAGFDPDGYLVGIGAAEVANSFAFVDVENGRMAGSVEPATRVSTAMTGPDRSSLETGVLRGQAISPIPTRASDWLAHVCGLMDRPFTDAELALLPEGVDTSPPCRR